MAHRTGRLPAWLLAMLESVGIDPSKEVGEIHQYNPNSDGTHCYGGFYHIVGTIVAAGPPFDRGSEDSNGDVSITTKLNLLSRDFPRPAIQVEFVANIPWVLPETPET